jgi:hypothetical protein
VVWTAANGELLYAVVEADDTVSSPLQLAVSLAHTPQVVVDAAGTVHVTWRQDDENLEADEAIYYTTVSGGVAGTAGEVDQGNCTVNPLSRPTLAVATDIVYIAWGTRPEGPVYYDLEGTEIELFPASPICFAQGSAGSWSVEALAGQHSQGDRLELQVDQNNQVYLLHGGHAWFEQSVRDNFSDNDKGLLNYHQETLVVERYDPNTNEWAALLANTYPTQDDTDEDGDDDDDRISVLDGDLALDLTGNVYATWIDDHEFWGEDNWGLRLRTTTLPAATQPQVTKHYYANGQRIASRVDSELYYVLNEPTGQGTLFVDATGTEVGHILYDAMGSVVEKSLELPEALVSHLDTTGLRWDGLRYYDSVVGIYTQPNPFGGVPEAPQSLNAYAAMPASSPSGIFLPSNGSFDGSIFFGLSVSLNKTSGYYARQASKRAYLSGLKLAGFRSGRSRWGRLSLEAAQGTLDRANLLRYFEGGTSSLGSHNRRAFGSRELVERIGRNVYRTVGGETIDLHGLMNDPRISPRWLRNVSLGSTAMPIPMLREVPALGRFTGLARFGLNALPFGVDAVWQAATDWETDMPVGYRIGRVGVAVGVGYGAGEFAAWAAAAILGVETAPAWAVIGVGVIVGVTVEEWIREGINDWWFPADSERQIE